MKTHCLSIASYFLLLIPCYVITCCHVNAQAYSFGNSPRNYSEKQSYARSTKQKTRSLACEFVFLSMTAMKQVQ